jgi:hypothetical protein
MARRCKRKKTITVLQKYGPAKKMRVCASYTKPGRAGSRGRRKHRWCVFKGKGKSAAKQTCHTNKRAAKHAAAVLRKGCRARIRVRRVKGA